MDVPIFHLDGMGNRMLIAIIAITHVVINHPMAVGAYPLITLFEWIGYRRKSEEWDLLAKRITFVTFLITTSIGALSGVGIWLSSALVSPFAIGSLLRVFFWNWLFEWTIFITEVVFILFYYYSWDSLSGPRKRIHLIIGFGLSLFSWVTMAVIVAILGFMMSSGQWTENKSLWSATLNPLYIPQLAFRTTFALTSAGLYVWFLLAFFTRAQTSMRIKTVRVAASWIVVFSPICLLSAVWYWSRIPDEVASNITVGLMTQKFSEWQSQFLIVAASVIGFMIVVAVTGFIKPKWIRSPALILTFLLSVGLLGHFERVREFIRKPFVIAGYMYSNGVRVDQLALFQSEGILPFSSYSNIGEITEENKRFAGEHVFLLTCTRCHTTNGMNGIVAKCTNLFGPDDWDSSQLENFIANMHLTRPYMPPFPGNKQELGALAAYICSIQNSATSLPGAQTVGLNRWNSISVQRDPSKESIPILKSDESTRKGEVQ